MYYSSVCKIYSAVLKLFAVAVALVSLCADDVS